MQRKKSRQIVAGGNGIPINFHKNSLSLEDLVGFSRNLRPLMSN